MSGGTTVAVAVTALAGVAGSIQVAVMGKFGERVGTLEAFGFATALTAVLALGALLVARRSVAGYGSAFEAPLWMWTGGVWGFVVVLTITFVAPKLGATATIGLLIAGQLAMGAVIDRYGLFGLEKIEIGWVRLLGIVLLAVGAALSLKK